MAGHPSRESVDQNIYTSRANYVRDVTAFIASCRTTRTKVLYVLYMKQKWTST
jgi:hypothetical protein